MEGRKKTMKTLGVSLAAALLVVGGLFGYRLFRQFQRKAELASALSSAFGDLNRRFSSSPLALAAGFLEPDCKFTADAILTQSTALAGQVTYDLAIQTDGKTHQLTAQGVAQTAEKSLDLSIYLGPSFAAVSSEGLVQGRFYGVTYDTFREDIRAIPLLGMMISGDLLEDWDDSLQTIRQGVNREYRLPKLPQIAPESVQMLLKGLVALPCQRELVEIQQDGRSISCERFHYQAQGGQVASAMTAITGQSCPQDAAVDAAFYLNEKSLARVELGCEGGGDRTQYTLELTRDPLTGPLKLTVAQEGGEAIQVSLETQLLEAGYRDSWTVRKGRGKPSAYAYEWDPSTGALTLRMEGDAEGVSMNLSRTEDGLRLVSGEFSQLLRQITRNESETPPKPVTCDLVLRTGSQITTPEYKNIDTWSLEDFYTLVLGVGSLLGIQLQ